MSSRTLLARHLFGPFLVLVVLLSQREQPWAALPSGALGTKTDVSALLALLRWLGIGISGWLVISGTAYMFARAIGASRTMLTVGRLTPKNLRLIIDRAIVTGTLVASIGTNIAVAAPPPPIEVPAAAEQPMELAQPTRPAQTQITHGIHRVESGDSFWKIAESKVEPDEVTRYWLRMIDLNLDVIKSGDPNLIYPGELLQLPS